LARVLSSDDPKGLWKGYQGEIGDFKKIKLQDDKDSGRQRFRKIKAAAKEGKAQRPDYPPRTTKPAVAD
jgi:hypothetical protein